MIITTGEWDSEGRIEGAIEKMWKKRAMIERNLYSINNLDLVFNL